MMPDISRATIYNTVKTLVSLGELHEVEELGETSKRYDPNTEPHHHLYCERCHQLIDIEPELNWISLSPEKTRGYKICRSQVTFYGLCPDCQGKQD